ncbi:MAG TPA: DinB family protein [Bryobacteraceae bacterium]|jgi:uncharacterized damage-inducible protein DinB|nr:DinB family protein [Bryobacteraceae bacterium]
MNCYGAKDLAAAFRTVRKNTIIIAEEIDESKYSFQPAKDTRTVAQQLVHIAVIPRIQLQIHAVEKLNTLAGFNFIEFVGPLKAEEQKPRSKAEIVTLLKESGEEFAGWVETLSDDFLAERMAMPPGMHTDFKTRFEMLLGTKEHEMHHRAQLMLIERLIGIVPHLTREFQARVAAMQSASAKP